MIKPPHLSACIQSHTYTLTHKPLPRSPEKTSKRHPIFPIIRSSYSCASPLPACCTRNVYIRSHSGLALFSSSFAQTNVHTEHYICSRRRNAISHNISVYCAIYIIYIDIRATKGQHTQTRGVRIKTGQHNPFCYTFRVY